MKRQKLADKLVEFLDAWDREPPGRATLHAAADALMAWRKAENAPGLWARPPRMLGATLDDGWGHGIRLILKFAEAMGCDTRCLGVLCPVDTIVEACKEEAPDILGLTVLQLDTEEALEELGRQLAQTSHKKPEIIAGGPAFTIDPDIARRVGIDFVAKDAAHFIRHMLKTADAEKKNT
jgi:methylmalonyl-CoA mutase cobalamin-binding subunit